MPNIVLPLAEMTVAEKLELMETLWVDLSRDPDEIPSPAWHGEVLRERQRQLDAGETHFIPLEEAVASLRRRAADRRAT